MNSIFNRAPLLRNEQFRQRRRRQSESPRRSHVELSIADAATAADSAESLAAHAAEHVPTTARSRTRSRTRAAAATATAEAPAAGPWAALTRGRRGLSG